MPLINVLCDVKVWILLGVVLALGIGFDSPNASTILMFVLIAQMAVSLDGIQFHRDDFKHYDKEIVISLLCCFGFNTLLTLACGLLFIDNSHLWTGWVMLSSVPCGVSVVVASLVMRGDTKMCVLSLTVIYICAIGLTPLITKTLLGDSVNPLEVLKYILLFIVVPFGLSFLVKRLHLKSVPKSVFINVMMLLMVFIGLGSRRDFIFSDSDVVMLLIGACLIRIFAASFILLYMMKRAGVKRDNAVVYLSMAAWKNSGMSISMTMALFAATMPDAVLPCVVSLVMEAAWFALMSKAIEKVWPVPASEEAIPVS